MNIHVFINISYRVSLIKAYICTVALTDESRVPFCCDLELIALVGRYEPIPSLFQDRDNRTSFIFSRSPTRASKRSTARNFTRLSFWLPVMSFPWISSTKIGSKHTYLSALFDQVSIITSSSLLTSILAATIDSLTSFEIVNGHGKMLLTGPQHWVVQSVEISCPSAVRKPLFFSLSLRVFNNGGADCHSLTRKWYIHRFLKRGVKRPDSCGYINLITCSTAELGRSTEGF